MMEFALCHERTTSDTLATTEEMTTAVLEEGSIAEGVRGIETSEKSGREDQNNDPCDCFSDASDEDEGDVNKDVDLPMNFFSLVIVQVRADLRKQKVCLWLILEYLTYGGPYVFWENN